MAPGKMVCDVDVRVLCEGLVVRVARVSYIQ